MLTRNKEALLETLFNTALWLLFITLVLPMLSIFLLFISGAGTFFLNDVHTVDQLETDLSFNTLTTILSFFLLLPFIKYSLSASDRITIYQRLGFEPLIFKHLFITFIIVLGYSIFEIYLFKFNFVEPPTFINELTLQLDTPFKVAILLLAVGFFGPALEEIIFRGIAFYKLKQSSLNTISIIIITSIGFTLIHSQYEQFEVFVLLFLSSCLLGGIRHLTGNLWYSILGHIMMNIMALTTVFMQHT